MTQTRGVNEFVTLKMPLHTVKRDDHSPAGTGFLEPPTVYDMVKGNAFGVAWCRPNRSAHVDSQETIYILGSGAVGFPLAAHLTNAGKSAIAVRTSRDNVSKGTVTVTVHDGTNRLNIPVETVSLSKLTSLDGIIVVTSKAHANRAISERLKDKVATGPIVLMQNGVGVEKPFIEAGFSPIYRCVLYVTGQTEPEEYTFAFRPVTASPIGVTNDDASGLAACVDVLTTDAFPFRMEANIQREIWKKAVINAVFNSICPLLNVDNGIFVRDGAAAELARGIVRECVTLTDRLDLKLGEKELMKQLMRISKSSDGQLISTLQDIRAGRETEIDFLNLEIARVAASLKPPIPLPRTEVLGKMIEVKSLQKQFQDKRSIGQ